MADFESSPQVQDPQEIRLYGNPYRIEGPIRVSMSTTLPGKIAIGDYGKNDNPFLSTYTIDDLRGGTGLFQYKDTQAELDRYSDTEDAATSNGLGGGVNTLWANAITLPYLSTSLSVPGGESTTQPILITSLAGTVIGVFTADIYTHDGTNWSAIVDTLPAQPVRRPIHFNSRVFYPLGASGYSYQTAAGSVAVDVTTPLFQAFTVWDNKIYGIDTSFVLYSSLTGNASTWETLATIPATTDIDNPFGDLDVYVDSDGSPTIWAHTHEGPFIYDAITDKWTRTSLKIPYIRIARANIRYCTVFQDSFFILAGEQTVYKLTMTGGTLIVQDVTPGLPDGFSITTWAISDLVADGFYLYAMRTRTPGGSGTVHAPMIYNNRGWSLLADGGSTSANIAHSMGLVDNANGNRLYSHRPGTGVVWHSVSNLRLNPRISTVPTYQSQGSFFTPWFSADYPSQQKLALRLRGLIIDGTSTETVAVAYAVNGSTSWTSLGTYNTAVEQALDFGTSSVGVAFRNIRFRLRMVRGNTTTTTPKIDHITLEFVRLPEILRGFVVTIDATEEYKGRTRQQQIDDLWTAISTTTLGTFSYRDDAGNTRSYLVKVFRPEGVEYSGYDESGKYNVYLVEFNG